MNKNAPVSQRIEALYRDYEDRNGEPVNDNKLGSRLNMEQTSLRRMRNGETKKPGPDKLFLLAQFFGVPMDYFYAPNWEEILQSKSGLVRSTHLNKPLLDVLDMNLLDDCSELTDQALEAAGLSDVRTRTRTRLIIEMYDDRNHNADFSVEEFVRDLGKKAYLIRGN